jgi:hypothetical protein
MHTINIDSRHSDETRRRALYQGQCYVFSPTSTTVDFVGFARTMVADAFRGLDPVKAQYHLPVEEYVQILAELKPRFIHHPASKKFLQSILVERGCDPELTYFDVPRLRTSTSDRYLTSGIAYAFHPHRDTWYSAPMCQINWWLPIYEAQPGNVMAFHPTYFDVPLKNTSREYNYQDWNRTSRVEAAKHIKSDARRQPTAQEEIDMACELRLVPPPGGMLVFSAAQLHSSAHNQTGETRFSIDFRTVHLGDLEQLRGAPNVDSHCTGTTLNDYRRVADLAHLSQELVERYMPGHPQTAGVGTAAAV